MTVSLASLRSEAIIAGIEAAPVDDVGAAVGDGTLARPDKGTVPRSIGERLLHDRPSIMDYVAAEADRTAIRAGTHTGDLAPRIQAMVDDYSAIAAYFGHHGGADVELFPGVWPISKVVLKTGVGLSARQFPGALGVMKSPVTIVPHASATDYLIDFAAGCGNCYVRGLAIFGLHTAPGSPHGNLSAIRVRGDGVQVLENRILYFGKHCVYLDAPSSNSHVMRNIMLGLYNAALDYSSGPLGVLHAHTSWVDGKLQNNQICGPTTYTVLRDPQQRMCAFYGELVAQLESSGNIFQTGDRGVWLVNSQMIKSIGDRFEFNAGDGLFADTLLDSNFVSPVFVNNCMSTNNTYSDVILDTNCGGVTFEGPIFKGNPGYIPSALGRAKYHLWNNQGTTQPKNRLNVLRNPRWAEGAVGAVTANLRGRRMRLAGGDVRAREFGALGDDNSNELDALQEGINYAAKNGRVMHLDGRHRIAGGSLLLPKTQKYGIVGEGATLMGDGQGIVQQTDNIPVLYTDTAAFSGGSGYIRDIRLDGFSIGHQTQQAAANTEAVGLQIRTMLFESNWGQLCFFNSVAGIGSKMITADITEGTIWGMNIAKLSGYHLALSLLKLDPPGPHASPNNHIGHIYALECGTADQYIINIVEWACAQIDCIEFNSVPKNAKWLKLTASNSNFRIGHFRLENQPGLAVPIVDDADWRMELNVKDMHFGCIGIEAAGWSNTANSLGLTRSFIPGSIIRIDAYRHNFNGGAGTSYTNPVPLLGHLATGVRYSIGRVDFDTSKGSLLRYDFIPAMSEQGQVDDHCNRRLSADKGDANYTFALGDETRIRYSTTLTAARTVTISLDRRQATSGLVFEVIRDAATPGAFDLVVKDRAAATVATIASGTKGGVRLGYSRDTLRLLQQWTL